MGRSRCTSPIRRTSDARYEHRSEGIIYDAVRADTKTNVVLTGKWAESDFGKGVFVAVFPIKESAEILLEAAATIPVESSTVEVLAKAVSAD